MPTVSIPSVSINTQNQQWYLWPSDGGGQRGGTQPDTDHGPYTVALHTDRKVTDGIGAYEKFKVVILSGGPLLLPGITQFALQTANGQFLTAINGGGIGGPDDGTCPIHTDCAEVQSGSQFTMVLDTDTNPMTASLITPDQAHFVTAVDGGNIGGNAAQSQPPVETKAQAAYEWETFFINTPYPIIWVSVVDATTGTPITDATVDYSSNPLVFGPVLIGDVYLVGVANENTTISWTAQFYGSEPINVTPNESGDGFTVKLPRTSSF